MKALHELEHIADYIRRTPDRSTDRHMGAYETSGHLGESLAAEISANHQYRPYMFHLTTRYRALTQDLLAQRGYGLLESFNLYSDAVSVIRLLAELHVEHHTDIPRILDWRQDPASFRTTLNQSPRRRTLRYLETIQLQASIDGNILQQSKRNLAQVTRLLFDDLPDNTANNVAYIEFSIDAQAAIDNSLAD